jgi:MFS family permease
MKSGKYSIRGGDNVSNKKVASCVLIIAFVIGFNIVGITPILGILNERYQALPTSSIQFLQTLPYAFLMVGSLSVGWFTIHISIKKMLLLGLGVIGWCGIAPFFFEGFHILLVSRLLIGFGFGLASPINTAIITALIPSAERPAYLGLHVVGMGIGSMAGNFFGGVLAGFGYRYFFLIYIAIFIVMIGISLILPESDHAAQSNKKDVGLNRDVYLLSVASFVHTLFMSVYSTNIALYIDEHGIGNTSFIGTAATVNAAFALIVGVGFVKIFAFLKSYTLPVSIFLAMIGYLSILLIPGEAGVFICSACCGASLSCFMAQCSYLISLSVAPEAVARASGVFSVIGGIGGFVSPILIGIFSTGLGGGNTAVNQFFISCLGMGSLGVAVLFLKGKKIGGINNGSDNH